MHSVSDGDGGNGQIDLVLSLLAIEYDIKSLKEFCVTKFLSMEFEDFFPLGEKLSDGFFYEIAFKLIEK